MTQSLDITRIDQQQLADAQSIRSVYVYELPVRVWHLVNALAIVVLAVSGWLIAHPLHSPSGEASSHYQMGYIRFAHFAAGYLLAVGLLGRVYWAVVGNWYARELFWVPLFQWAYWQDLWAMLKWYGFVSARPGQYIGHNPLARFSMFFLFLLPLVFMLLTGFALYAEGQQVGSWFEGIFGWVIPLFGSSQDVHTAHHLGMWTVFCFVIVHVYATVREEILGRSSMVSTMVSGYRTFKD
ncbi:Ni/Fe-hydrogenase, b-type cytochrome subunit [Aquabacterium sp. OR-4]|uniref:Ni/Fe-hydrogenase, b-type cytochrome subunit n=1 Tax=Aquabacterium sp. OR-4 TaxID=2978127 RepID=UPI0028C901C8|nr:Ni/Fe-hydrogenase, b-type cytochrome subunit [Aquabacterium sp. OR-4]MDT7834425.1 Ni/Fe-hydrogenase, b-type cytochrome subunit [Aquabacterium sp. OR-4]